MTSERTKTGTRAETEACQHFLRGNPGARLLARNFRCLQGEIDLIFEDEGEWIFVEVRYRSRASWITGTESVTFGKRRRLRNAIEIYLARSRERPRGVRFDILSLDRDSQGTVNVSHLRNVWLE